MWTNFNFTKLGLDTEVQIKIPGSWCQVALTMPKMGLPSEIQCSVVIIRLLNTVVHKLEDHILYQINSQDIYSACSKDKVCLYTKQ
jgi:hypothetical protein